MILRCYAVLAPVSRGYPPLKGRLVTCYSPGRHFTQGLLPFLVRLACVKRAASVDSEPGSNSRLISLSHIASVELGSSEVKNASNQIFKDLCRLPKISCEKSDPLQASKLVPTALRRALRLEHRLCGREIREKLLRAYGRLTASRRNCLRQATLCCRFSILSPSGQPCKGPFSPGRLFSRSALPSVANRSAHCNCLCLPAFS